MSKYILSVTLFTLFVIIGTTDAQITIIASDIQRQNAVGTTHTLGIDSTTKTIDIGTPGAGSNTWDFSNLTPAVTYNVASVDPATTPYIKDFPAANIVFFYNLNYMGVLSDSYIYNRIDTNYTSLGIESSGSPFPGALVVSKVTLAPPAISLKLPATMGTSWQQTYSETTKVTVSGNPFQATVSTIKVSSIIDAYGTAKLPGGKTADVLRIKRDERIYSPTDSGQTNKYAQSISYLFYSNTGDFVSVAPLDSAQPDHGKINILVSSWNQYAVTAVSDKGALINEFALEQNYPNPFNPSTSIKYSIPENSYVELKIFDPLGKEIKTLINQNQSKGNYTLNFNAGNLPSGMYIARLKAGSNTKSIKMLLMK